MTLPINQAMPRYIVFADDNLLVNWSLPHKDGRGSDCIPAMGAEAGTSSCPASIKCATYQQKKLRNYKNLYYFYTLSSTRNKAYSTFNKQFRDNLFSLHRPLASPATSLFFCHALTANPFEAVANIWIQDST